MSGTNARRLFKLAAGGGVVLGAIGTGYLLHKSRIPAPEGNAVFEDHDWRKSQSRAQSFTNKFTALLTHHASPAVPREEWELEIASRPGLHMHRTVSTLAASASSDGLILKASPRVYAPSVPLTDAELQSEDLKEVLKKRNVFCVWHFGDDGVSHPLTVHGGAIAMAFDESFGHAFVSLGRGVGYTANININYRKPLLPGQPILISFEKLEGRKVFMRAKLTNRNGEAFSDGTSLYVIPRSPQDTLRIKHDAEERAKAERRFSKRHPEPEISKL